MENTLMIVLDYAGDEEAMVYAQLGQHPLARATETSPERSSGTLSCLSARPPDLLYAMHLRYATHLLYTMHLLYAMRR